MVVGHDNYSTLEIPNLIKCSKEKLLQLSSNLLFKERNWKSSGVLKMSCETMNFSLYSDLSISVL